MKSRLKGQVGFIASYLLYGIGLLAIVGMAYGRLSTANHQSKIVQEAVDEISTQLEVISGKIMLCAAIYPNGDHQQFGVRHAYPSPSTPDHRANLSAVECPGAPIGSKALSTLSDGVPLPLASSEFNEWIYEHSELGGVRLRLDPKVTNGGAPVRERLLRKFPNSAFADADNVVFQILY